MDKDANLGLSEDEKAHQNVMRSIAIKMADIPYVLKGGTALLFTRGLDRHSTDLDFDGGISADAVRLKKSEEDGRFRAVLTYWKLDPVALARNQEPERTETGDQFDLWGAWHPEEIARIGSGKLSPATQLSEPEEGSGRTMGR